MILLAVCLVAAAIGMWFMLGGEFMPALEEGNIWLRATLPIGISFEEASRVAADMRHVFRQYPETRTAVSQLGRPDDGTDPTGFFNVEFLVDLKPKSEWRPEITSKGRLIAAIERELSEKFPGVTLNFSQMIQDNVQEAMTGVKGENSIKIFGHDLSVLEDKAEEVRSILGQVRGIRDLGVLHTLGQPNLLIEVDRSATARYGLEVDDVNAVIQAAIGGQSVTQVFEGEKWFDLVVRYLPEYRKNAQRIGDIQVITSSGSRIPLKQLALIKESVGPFMIYRENNHRYIPVKFSVRGRDLETTVNEARRLISEKVELPKGYRLEWHGEFTQLQGEKRRLSLIVPLSLLVIFLIVSYALHSVRDGLLVLAAVPFALVGGIIALFVSGTHFSISAAVGFLSVFGVAIQGALVDISRLHEYFDKGFDLRGAILKNAEVRMRPVMMTTLSAAIGLIPASVATGIGAQSQQPLARVVVVGMLSAVTLILIVLPVLYQRVHRGEHRRREAAPTTKEARGYSAALLLAALAFVGCGQRDEGQALSAQSSKPPSNIVSVSPRAQDELVVQEIRARPLAEEFVVQGRMQYGPDGYVNVSSPVTGLIKQVQTRLGEVVKSGQVLLTIQSADVGTAYSDFTKAESELDLAQRSYQLARDLLKVKAIPEKEYEQAENDYLKSKAEYDRARRRLLILRVPARELDKPPDQRTITARFDLKSPLNGVVVEKNVTIGAIAAPGTTLYTIANPDLLQAIGEIYERDLRAVKPGMPAVVRSESFPDVSFPATIRYVGDRVDPVSRTIKIRCDVNNIEQKLKVDMFVRIHLGIDSHLAGLAVPEEAVLRLGDEAIVFVERHRVSMNGAMCRPVRSTVGASKSAEGCRAVNGSS